MSGSAEVSAIEFQLTNGGPPVKFDQLLCTLVIDENKGVHSIALLQKVMERYNRSNHDTLCTGDQAAVLALKSIYASRQ